MLKIAKFVNGMVKELANIILTGDVNRGDEILALTNRYFSTIPHYFGRRKAPVIGNIHLLKREIDLLESLSDMRIAEEIMKDSKKRNADSDVSPIDAQYASLNMAEMTPLDCSVAEYNEIKDYLCKSVGVTHGTNYEVEDVFRIERNGEFDRFDQSEYRKLKHSNRRLLWHGSRATNFGGTLSQGERAIFLKPLVYQIAN
jgi:poly [ADP-ribose] polymerase